jgi:hypothetical protein
MRYGQSPTRSIPLPEIWKPLPKTNRNLSAPFDGDSYLFRIGGLAWQGRLQGPYWDLAKGPRVPHQSPRHFPEVSGWLPLSLLDRFWHTHDIPPSSHSVVVQLVGGGYWRSGFWSVARNLWELPDLQLDRSAPVRRIVLRASQISAWVDLEEIATTLWRTSQIDAEVAW